MEELGQTLVRSIWPSIPQLPSLATRDHYAAFLGAAQSEIHSFNTGAGGSTLQVVGICRLVQVLRGAQDLSKQHVIDHVRGLVPTSEPTPVSDDTVCKMIESGLRIWLTMDVPLASSHLSGPYASAPLSQTSSVRWTEDSSIKNTIWNHFQTYKSSGRHDPGTRIDSVLTMEHVANEYGYSIHWTSNLSDHLIIDRDGARGEITIYEHKICLVNHLAAQVPVFPKDLLEETIDTLNLLFPFEDGSTKGFLRKRGKTFYGLGRCGRERVLELDKYVYWKARIEDLMDILKGQPQGLQQLRLDKRRQNLMQIFTFWVAATVALLTVMSFVFGMLSTVYAKKQYDISVLQYQLSLAQACSAEGAPVLLPAFCL